MRWVFSTMRDLSQTTVNQATKSCGKRELNYDVPSIKDVCAQDLVAEAYKELMAQEELKEEYQRVAAVSQKWGY